MDSQASKLEAETPKRRRFLGWLLGGAGAAAGLGFIGWRVLTHGEDRLHPVPAGLPPLPSHDAFAQQLQSNFAVTAQAPEGEAATPKPVELKLIEVSESKTQLAGNRSYQSYFIMLEGPRSSALTQQTCTFKHPTLGTFDLFLVPVGKPKGDVIRYQAIFSIFS